MKFLPSFIFILFFGANISAQSVFIKGQTSSAQDNSSLAGATVQLFSLPDSALVTGDITNQRGIFRLTNIKPGKYYLVITFIGYKKYSVNVDAGHAQSDLGKILMEPSGIERQAIEIIGKTPPAALKSDTSEYNAAAFKISKDAMAEDLVSKMPGIVVQDGKFQAHGEEVKKVLVDGRPFLGDDPNAVLKNMPAEVIEKIQVFDQQSEQAQFSGYDDGNTNKTINIVTRPSFRDGTFGKLSAGYGENERYKAGGNLNFFDESQRITLLTQFNNINDQNFASEDLLGIMSSGGGRREMGRRGGGGGQGGGSRGTSDFTVDTKNGLTDTKAVGLNFADRYGTALELNGSYFYNTTDNNASSFANRKYITESLMDQSYTESSNANSDNLNHRLNLRLDYRIDSANTMTFTPKLSFQKNDGTSFLSGKTYSASQLLNSVATDFSSYLEALSTSGELLYRHRFAERGRTISINASGSYKKNTGNNNLFSETLYYDSLISSDTTDQYSNLYKEGYTGSANIVYTEPISSRGQLQFNFKTGYTEEESDQKTYDANYTNPTPDSSLSNIYRKIYRTQSIGTGYRYQFEGFSLNTGISYNISKLENSQTYPLSVKTTRTFYSLLPSFMLRYNISKDKNLRLSYRTNNNEPSVDQLQNVLNNSNSVQLSIGNPSLKQDYSHSVNIHYSSVDFENMNSFFIMLNGTYTNNYIGSTTLVASRDTVTNEGIELLKGTQLTRPENLNGYISLRSFTTYSLPVKFIQSNLNLMANVNYSRTPGKINGIENYTYSNVYGLGFVLSSNVSEYLDFTVSTNSSFNRTRNSSRSSSNTNYFTQKSALKFNWEFWMGFYVQTDLTHQYNEGLSSQYDNNTVLWNMSFGKKLFSKNQCEIRFTAYDILEQNTNVLRTTNSLYYEDTTSNVLGPYYLFSFIYNIKYF